MSRLGYFSRKLSLAALTIVGAVACLFLPLEFVPGNLADAGLGTNATPELRAASAEKMRLDQPLYVRMVRFLAGGGSGRFWGRHHLGSADHGDVDAGFSLYAGPGRSVRCRWA